MRNCAELTYFFEHIYQGEMLSVFVTHLDKMIHEVIMKGGMEAEATSKALLTQVLKEVQTLDLILLKYRKRDQNGPLESF